jgi:tetratricopeptide (TPR) repeat protein
MRERRHRRGAAALGRIACAGALVVVMGASGCSSAERAPVLEDDACSNPTDLASEPCLRQRMNQVAALQLAGDLEAADSALEEISTSALNAGLRSVASEALVRRSATRIRLEGLPGALALLDRAEELAPPDPVSQATLHCQRATVLNVVGRPEALQAGETGLDHLGRPTPEDWSREGSQEELGALGRCLMALGQYWSNRSRSFTDRAVLHLTGAADALHRSGDPGSRAAALQWRGNTLRAAASYLDAAASLEEAASVARESGNGSVTAWATLGLAAVHLDLGDPGAAQEPLVRADSLMASMGDRVGIGYVRTFLAEQAIRANRPAEALAILDRAEADLVALGDSGFPLRTLPIRIRALRAEGNHPEARRVVDLLLERTGTDPSGTVREPVDVGSIPVLVAVAAALDAGDLDRAHFLLETAPPFREVSRFAGWVRSARAAEVAARRGETLEARTHLREALDILRAFRGTLRTEDLTGDLRAAALGLAGADPLDPDLGLATVVEHLASAGMVDDAFVMAAELRGWSLEQDRLRARALDVGQPVAPVTSLADDHAPDLLRRFLAADEAVLFYVTGRRGEPTSLFMVTAEETTHHTLPGIDDLDPLLRRLDAQFQAGAEAWPLRRRLGETLLGPALPRLARVSRLMVIPDQGLNRLPFEALVLPESTGEAATGGAGSRSDPAVGDLTVVERFVVTSVPSPGILAELRLHPRRLVPGRGVLALSQPRPAPRDPWTHLPRLRWAGWETRGVARSIPGSRRLTGSRATSAALLEGSSGGYAALHVAAHALVDEEIPARSAILLGPVGSREGELRLSQIERVPLDLSLVVLSACGTAGGREVRGEGLRGPARAFLSSGVASVVATAWPVEDRAAAEQMRRFYDHLGRGLPVDEALALVKRERIIAGHPPSDWAAFQLFGEPDTRLVNRLESTLGEGR